MATVAGFPYFEVEFGKDGEAHDPAQARAALDGVAAAGATDLVVLSHGWNNDMAEARDLYQRFLTHVRGHLDAGAVPGAAGRAYAVLAVLWPSKKFAEADLIPANTADGGGAASIGGGGGTAAELEKQLRELQGFFDDPDADARLERARQLVPALENDPAARDEYVAIMTSLVPAEEGDETADVDASDRLPADDGNGLLARLAQPVLDVEPGAGGFEGGAGGAAGGLVGGAFPPEGFGGGAGGVGDVGMAGGAAGIGDIFGGIAKGAKQLANLTTYYQMKKRAGLVGTRGLAPILRQVRDRFPTLRVHLAGHSFGGRLLTAAALGLEGEGPLPVSTLTLLQAAYSHYGLAENFREEGKDGFFRRVLSERRVEGPVVITHTRNDKAVGLAYALASRLAGQDASAFGDENSRFGGMGGNGAQDTPERVAGTLEAPGAAYGFERGRVYNLKADQFIAGHSEIANPATAYAFLSAVATT